MTAILERLSGISLCLQFNEELFYTMRTFTYSIGHFNDLFPKEKALSGRKNTQKFVIGFRVPLHFCKIRYDFKTLDMHCAFRLTCAARELLQKKNLKIRQFFPGHQEIDNLQV